LHAFAVPATQEAEARGSLEPRHSRQPGNKVRPLHVLSKKEKESFKNYFCRRHFYPATNVLGKILFEEAILCLCSFSCDKQAVLEKASAFQFA
jgi:hypothetical protein